MGSPSAVITMGLGSWGSVGEVLTLGYGSSSVVIVAGPFRSVAGQAHSPGSVKTPTHQFHEPGCHAGQSHTPGSDKGQYT